MRSAYRDQPIRAREYDHCYVPVPDRVACAAVGWLQDFRSASVIGERLPQAGRDRAREQASFGFRDASISGVHHAATWCLLGMYITIVVALHCPLTVGLAVCASLLRVLR